MANIVKMASDSRGNFRRDLGWKVSESGGYTQQRFYVGTKRDKAEMRVSRLERLWDAVEKTWQQRRKDGKASTPRPLWDALTIDIGLAIARGDEAITIDPVAYPGGERLPPLAVAYFFAGVAQDFGGCGIHLVPSDQAEQVRQEGEQEKKEIDVLLRRKTSGGPTLHKALDAFGEWIGQTMLEPDGSGQMTPTAVLHQRQIKQIKEHSENVPLAKLDTNAIESIIYKWENRPVSRKTKRPMAKETVRDVIKRIRKFLRWLHRNPAFEWRFPADYEPHRINIKLTAAERAAKAQPHGRKTYGLDELGTLWEYASPHERLFMVLALNCGFGQAEVSGLQREEIHLDQPHGYYPIKGDFIKRIRGKTGVYGEWMLWPETVQAIEWAKRKRGESTESALILSKTGKPLTQRTANSNRNMEVANAWYRAVARVKKDFPLFRKLSFNKLRKTSSTFIRRPKVGGGEVAGVFLCHGRVCSDDLLEVYAERDFRAVFRATRKLRKALAPMFAKVSDPFPEDMRKSNPSLSLGQRKRMQTLRDQGFTLRRIAELCEVTRHTVARYTHKANA